MGDGLAHHSLYQPFLFDQFTLACIDPRRQREIVAGATFGKVQLLNGLLEVAHQGEVFSTCLMQADDIAGQAKMIGNLEVNGLSYRLMDELPKHFESVSVQDIQRVANAYFVRENLSTLYLSPEQNTQQRGL